MTGYLAFVLAVVALLAVPGPTNTLLAASGATAGFRRSLGLLPAELAGYGISIAVLLAIVGPIAAAHPSVPVVSKLVAAAYLAWSAVVIWRRAATGMAAEGPVSFARVFVTTLLNPKALVFAFAIFPPLRPAALAPFAGLFALLVVTVAIGWIGLGASLGRSAGSAATPVRIARLAALALGLFAILIFGSAAASILA